MLKKHLKKIVSLVLVTMMAIGMSITAIAAEPYQNELEAVMDTSLADSGQVTHYDTYTSNSEYGVDYTWTVPAKTGYYYVAYTITLCCYTNSDCRCCRCKCRKQLWIQNKPLGYLGQYHNV